MQIFLLVVDISLIDAILTITLYTFAGEAFVSLLPLYTNIVTNDHVHCKVNGPSVMVSSSLSLTMAVGWVNRAWLHGVSVGLSDYGLGKKRKKNASWLVAPIGNNYVLISERSSGQTLNSL